MYHNPQKNAAAAQSYIHLTQIKSHLQQCPGGVKVMERSIYSARNVFMENMKNNKAISNVEYTVLDEWHKWATSTYNLKPNLISIFNCFCSFIKYL